MVTRIILSLKKAADVSEADLLLSKTAPTLAFAEEVAPLATIPPARCSLVSGSVRAGDPWVFLETAVDPVGHPGLTGLQSGAVFGVYGCAFLSLPFFWSLLLC
jgi:hypothetical protein